MERSSDSIPNSNCRARQIQYARRLSHGLQAVANYTWSSAIDNASSDSLARLRITEGGTVGVGGGVPNVFSPNLGRGPSDFDVRHSLTAAASYNLPAPRGKALVNEALRDWSVDAVFRARTATPVNIVVRSDVVGPDLVLELQRPDLVPGVPLYLSDPTVAGGI